MPTIVHGSRPPSATLASQPAATPVHAQGVPAADHVAPSVARRRDAAPAALIARARSGAGKQEGADALTPEYMRSQVEELDRHSPQDRGYIKPVLVEMIGLLPAMEEDTQGRAALLSGIHEVFRSLQCHPCLPLAVRDAVARRRFGDARVFRQNDTEALLGGMNREQLALVDEVLKDAMPDGRRASTVSCLRVQTDIGRLLSRQD